MRGYYLIEIAIIGVLRGFLSLIIQLKHLLGILLSLEAVTINIFILLYGFRTLSRSAGFIALILISLGACEASLGLSILVSIIRTCGNDYVSRLSRQKC